jgi:hypothetical protein
VLLVRGRHQGQRWHHWPSRQRSRHRCQHQRSRLRPSRSRGGVHEQNGCHRAGGRQGSRRSWLLSPVSALLRGLVQPVQVALGVLQAPASALLAALLGSAWAVLSVLLRPVSALLVFVAGQQPGGGPHVDHWCETAMRVYFQPKRIMGYTSTWWMKPTDTAWFTPDEREEYRKAHLHSLRAQQRRERQATARRYRSLLAWANDESSNPEWIWPSR